MPSNAPLASSPYIRLLRLHQPAGIWLLLFPCWWSVALASDGLPSPWLMLLFGVGAVVMRGAGCIINDMADREFDRKVERTRSRPLASGELTLWQAICVLGVLLAIANLIALQMNPGTLLLALGSLPLVATYPFMKRITWWPQAFLGLTFNWGALMGWTAVKTTLGLPALLLYVGGVFWTLGYDTIYAHQDKADDTHAGVKSSALRLGEHTRSFVAGFYALATALWAGAITLQHGQAASLLLIPVAAHFYWQVASVDLNNPGSCMHYFRSNRHVGWMLLVACML